VLDLNSRPIFDLKACIRDARFAECLLYILDKLDAIEGKTETKPESGPKFQDRSFIVPYQGDELCRPEHRDRALAEGYEITGTASFEPGKNYLKLRRVA